VDSVRVSQGSAVVYLRVLDTTGYVIPVHIGEAESNALLKEINKQRQSRPLTHDMAKNMLQAIGFRVTKVRAAGRGRGVRVMGTARGQRPCGRRPV
jgi:bifunctional DNase/RNase